MKRIGMILFKALLLFIVHCSALYPKNGLVVELTSNNFDKLVLNGNEIWIVEFFAPWCGHCQNLVPEFTKAANTLNGVVKFGAVNADQYKDLARKYKIGGFPTIYIFFSNKNQPIHYDGKRTARDIVDTTLRIAKEKVNEALWNEIPLSKSNEHIGEQYYLNRTNIVQLNDTNFHKQVLQSDKLWLINFYAPWCEYCKKFAHLWVKIAVDLDGKFSLGVIDCTKEQRLANKYNIKKYPTVQFFSSKAESPIEYDGEYLINDISHWALERMADFLPDPEIVQIVDENTFRMACDEKQLCIFTVLPHIYDCQSNCRNAYLNLLRKLGKQFKLNLWGWAWSEASSQPHIEDVLGFGGFGYPALAAINIKKSRYSIFKGSFSEISLHKFLRNVAYGHEKCNSLKSKELFDVIIVEKWDGKDHHLPVETDDESDERAQKDEL